jgi:hypothetical protein
MSYIFTLEYCNSNGAQASQVMWRLRVLYVTNWPESDRYRYHANRYMPSGGGELALQATCYVDHLEV